MSNQTMATKSRIVLNSVAYPVYPNCAIEAPENYSLPVILGNLTQINQGDGFIMPYITVSFAVRDANDNILKRGGGAGTGLLDYLINRTNDSAFESTNIGLFEFWNGRQRYYMANTKLDSMTFSCSKGDDLHIAARFCGTSLDVDNSAPSTAWTSSTARMIKFNDITYGTALADVMLSWSLTYSNNHSPDMTLGGNVATSESRRFPMQCNAGIPTCTFDCVIQAIDALSNSNQGLLANDTDLTTTATITVTNKASTRSVTFTIPRVANQTPRNTRVTLPKNFKNFSYNVMPVGASAATDYPLTVANSTLF